MPSLSEIANQVNNTLNQVETNTQDTASTVGLIKGDTADINLSLNTIISELNTVNAGINAVNAELNTITGTLQTGFSNLSLGLDILIDSQNTTNHLLDHNREQNDTIICWLANIANVLCRQLHRQNKMVELQTAIDDSLDQMKETFELVHGTETVEVLRRRALKERLDECCPPEEPTPEICFEDCRTPDYNQPEPTRDFDPVKFPDRPNPVG